MSRSVSIQSPINWASPLNRGLLRWWYCLPNQSRWNPFRELTRRSHMTIAGASAFGSRGRPGGFGCYQFNGTSDYGQTAAIDLSGISTMTLTCWLYWDAFANDNDLLVESSADSSATNQGAISILPNSSTTEIVVRVNASGTTFNSYRFARPSAAAWHHYAFCYDRNGGAQQVTAVYVDGVSQSLTSVAANTTATGGFGNYAWNFMSRNGGASLQGAGRLDDIRIYNRALPAWEARALLHASRRRYPSELRWIRGAEFGGYEEPVAEETEVQTFSVGGAGPLGSEEIPNTVLASATSLTPPAGTKYATIQAVGANFNFFLSGDTPTTGTTGDGRKLYNYGMIELDSGFTSAKFIREGSTANSKLVVEYFSRKLEE